MSNMFPNNQEHLEGESLLLFVDGEMTAKDASTAQAHLDACWDCRGRVSGVQATIADFMEFENRISKFQNVSENFKGNFDSKLRALTAEMNDRPQSSRLANIFRPFFNFSVSRQSIIAGAAMLLILAIVWQFVLTPTTVSAKEILDNSISWANRANEAVFQPVVYQKYRVKKIIGATEAENLTLEIWKDTLLSRRRMALNEGENRRFIAVNNSSEKDKTLEITPPPVLLELAEVLRKNRMDQSQPLSAQSFANWRNSVKLQSETVEKSLDENGAEILTIKAVSDSATEKGLIKTAEFSVRANDWGAVKLIFDAQNDTPQKFEITEAESAVISFKDLDPNILSLEKNVTVAENSLQASPFASDSPAEKEEKPKDLKKDTAANTNANLSSTEADPKPDMSAATAEDELEVLRVLQDAKADLGEQVSVTKEADGKISVSGIVENKARKDELIKALQAVADARKVKINIRSVDELKKTRLSPNKSETIQTEEIPETTSVPVDKELRAFFSKNGVGGTQLNERIESFSRQILARSRRASQFAWSLRKLAEGFSPKQVAEFTPEAKARRNNLLLARVTDFRREIGGLRGDLQPIFGNLSGSIGGVISSEQDLQQAVKRLADVSRNLDEAVRGSFTIGNSANAAAVGDASFAQNLKTASGLAEQIENYLRK